MFQISLTKILVAYLIFLLVMLFGVWLIRERARKKREKEERRCRFICNFCGGHTKIVLEKMSLNAQIAAHLMSVQPLVTCSIIFC